MSRLRELAVVGEQDQAAAVGVQAPDRVQATLLGATSSTTVGRPWVSRAVESDADRLVQRVDDPLLGARERLPVDLDAIALVDVARRVAHELAVDAHAPGDDQRLGGAPRGDAGMGEVLGEAHRLPP